jgi:RNA polymerase sigma factor for flagellar operon FliA
LEAIDRYDPGRGVPFELYARHRVRGSVFNGLRLLRESLAKGSSDYGDAGLVRDRIASLDDEDTADPVEAFVATAVGLGLGFLLNAQSLPTQEPQPDAYAEAERVQSEATLARCVELLPERERLLLTLHYYHHVPFVQVADHLGVTKGRVSQLHKQALDRLRRLLREYWAEVL